MIKSKMSLKQAVTNAVDEIIVQLLTQISTKYEIDINELMIEWNNSFVNMSNSDSKKLTKEKSTPVKEQDLSSQTNLSTLKKSDLQTLCRENGLKCSGTKEQLLRYLSEKKIEGGVSTEKSVVEKVSKNSQKEETPVVKKLSSAIPIVSIRRNRYGNHEHSETTLVFDTKTKKAIGKQNSDGTIEELTEEDIDICNQWKFIYDIPVNLDKKTNLTDVKIDELEDDDVVESDEEVTLEEELIDEDEEEYEEEYEEEMDEYE
jgi:hypothetical protein